MNTQPVTDAQFLAMLSRLNDADKATVAAKIAELQKKVRHGAN